MNISSYLTRLLNLLETDQAEGLERLITPQLWRPSTGTLKCVLSQRLMVGSCAKCAMWPSLSCARANASFFPADVLLGSAMS
ncbi:hypothetical protein VNO77_21018 [Canavalia gladiata]|uniref:Uncharacterized protein n=1 Tax=Canavalia gladiata TaxID=3824 RepID=A0AAN9LR70_CANGL